MDGDEFAQRFRTMPAKINPTDELIFWKGVTSHEKHHPKSISQQVFAPTAPSPCLSLMALMPALPP
jgi:hypothetical protein